MAHSRLGPLHYAIRSSSRVFGAKLEVNLRQLDGAETEETRPGYLRRRWCRERQQQQQQLQQERQWAATVV